MKKIFFTILIVGLLVSLVTTPARAITFGHLDGANHPNVGALVVDFPGYGKDVVCSGTLISDNIFLTAAHCVDWMPAAGFQPDQVWVTFDPVFSQSGTFYHGTYYEDPLYNHTTSNPDDMAVIVLDAPVFGITPASLPISGLLDDMKASGTLKNQQFVTVGYGTVRDDKTGGPHALYWEGARRFAEQTFNALTASWLKLSENPSTGNGGTCYGDSGGPHFLGTSNTVVALTVTGDYNCRATDVDYRLDTPSARSFLGGFVSLP
jgi:secreted trypsin-like serine protease